MKTTPIYLYTNDIQRITGRNKKCGRRLIERRKEHLKAAVVWQNLKNLHAPIYIYRTFFLL